MRFKGRIDVYCQNHTIHTDTLCGQNAVLAYKARGTYSNLSALKG
jgi:hypothetical protein